MTPRREEGPQAYTRKQRRRNGFIRVAGCCFRFYETALPASGTSPTADLPHRLQGRGQSGFGTVRSFPDLWLRRRNGAFRVSGPFAGPPAIRVWNRSFLFHRRVFQILRLGKNASELAFFSRLIHFGCGAVTALSGCRDLLPGRPRFGYGTVRSFSIAESFRYSASEKMQASLLFSLGLFVLWLCRRYSRSAKCK